MHSLQSTTLHGVLIAISKLLSQPKGACFTPYEGRGNGRGGWSGEPLYFYFLSLFLSFIANNHANHAGNWHDPYGGRTAATTHGPWWLCSPLAIILPSPNSISSSSWKGKPCNIAKVDSLPDLGLTFEFILVATMGSHALYRWIQGQGTLLIFPIIYSQLGVQPRIKHYLPGLYYYGSFF